MCGIVGYVGERRDIQIGLDALRRLEYRGYDSSGIAGYDAQASFFERAVGKISALEEKCALRNYAGEAFILHTRWGSHGRITEENCHPHTDCARDIFVVHNGIIENFSELKEGLQKRGHIFRSETDTEVIPHLIEQFFEGNLEDAVCRALSLVRGSYGIAAISPKDPGKIVAARLSSPLVVSVNETGGFVASDPAALLSHSSRMVFLDDGDIAVIRRGSCDVTDLRRNRQEKKETEISWSLEEAQKGGHEHFMLKEIMEQPQSLQAALRGRILREEGRANLGGLQVIAPRLREIERIDIVACGTAYYAGVAGEYMLEEHAGIPSRAHIASEFRYRNPIVDKRSAVLALSQSGETADTLGALREAKGKGGLSLGIVNVVGSTIAREIEAGVYNHAGPEIGVASTKAFTSQIAVLALLTVFLGRQRSMTREEGRNILEALEKIPESAARILQQAAHIKEIAEKYQSARDFLFLGRKYSYATALEGALKLKEISYAHAEGYGAGEMKHGPLALIDEKFPTVVVVPRDSVYEKTCSNIQEIRVRKGPVIAVATEGDEDIRTIADEVVYIPRTLEMLTPILSVIPLQLFAYHMAVLRGHNPDYPRNLSKVVTVE